jgi:hypothetical protein
VIRPSRVGEAGGYSALETPGLGWDCHGGNSPMPLLTPVQRPCQAVHENVIANVINFA